jgi:membrane protein implicated in regulation of membrane protease activity
MDQLVAWAGYRAVVATGTLIFLIIGGVGIAVLVLALLGTELVHIGNPDVEGPISLEAIAGFIGVLGFGGAIASELLNARTPGMLAVAAALGAVAALPAAWFAARLARAARDMPTDPTPSRADLAGALGVVVTPIPAAGYGEVRVNLAGQPVKFNAKADRPIAAGAKIFVVEALSETSVLVETY